MLGFYIFFFVLGLVVGSFLNSIIYRLKTKESILKTRSYCPFCKKQLKWFELIPIISFLIQKGRCRKCQKKISWQYPIVELATGLIFISIFNFQFSPISSRVLDKVGTIFNQFFNFQFFISTIFLLIISCFLIILFVYDLKHYLVPDVIIYPAIVLTFGFRIWGLFRIWDLGFGIWLGYILAVAIGGAFFLIIVLISHGKWMGIGDIKIGVLMGLILGTSNLLAALFLAFLSGAVISIILLIIKKKTLKSEIPFGPFLVGATFIVIFWGDVLINWYFNLFT